MAPKEEEYILSVLVHFCSAKCYSFGVGMVLHWLSMAVAYGHRLLS